MPLRYELFMALRYLRAKKKHKFISIISAISTGGVALGVMALIVVIAVMAGFENHLRTKILGINAHLLVRSYTGPFDHVEAIKKRIEGVSIPPKSAIFGLFSRLRHGEEGARVICATPIVYIQALLSSGRAVSGVAIRGVDPESVKKVVTFGKIISGRGISAFKEYKGGDIYPIIIGKELALTLGISAGDSIRIVLPSGTITPIGMMPRIRTVRVIGVQSIGMYEYDMSLAFMPLKAAQRLLGLKNQIHAFEVKVSDIYMAPQISKKIMEILGYPFWVMDWQQMSRNLFSAMELEKFAMFVVLTLIVLVAAFNIISTLSMMVMEKKSDIAILKAMGATNALILRIFMLHGSIIGFLGTFLGVSGGIGLCWLLKRYKFIKIPKEVYYTDTIPILLYKSDVAMIAICALIICVLATIYPARQASKVDPSKILRNA